jgi:hypothetical protein
VFLVYVYERNGLYNNCVLFFFFFGFCHDLMLLVFLECESVGLGG